MDLKKLIPILLTLLFIQVGCKDDMSNSNGIDLTNFPYDPVIYEVATPVSYPRLEFPDNNPLTVDGVELGRHLFYDPILSVDSTMACASCHLPIGAFTDNLAVSPGVDDIAGNRSAMTLIDVGFHLNGLFWDGRVQTLEEQALLPVEDELELNNSWPEVIADLQAHSEYPQRFRAAFGIDNSSEITRELAAQALAQFERSLVSSGNSLFDRVNAGRAILSKQEQMGFDIFFDERIDLPDGQCFHCHSAPLFTDNLYRNNGLDSVPDFEGFPDLGLGGFTGERVENGKFRTPTLRNIEFSAPYMHDGRFETLDEVLDHYVSGGLPSINKDPLMDSIQLNNEQKAAVIAFLMTLSDTTALNDPRYAKPD